jgi:starvation-inducible DNA-binding protein
MEKVNIGLEDKQRSGVVKILNGLLADEHVLYIKTRNYHWNVVGPRFHSLHLFLEEQYKLIEGTIDEVAETARQFGGLAAGTLSEFSKLTRLHEKAGDRPDEDGMLRNLLNDHETIIQALRKDIEKADDEFGSVEAADFLTTVLEQHNKMAWMLRAFLPSSASGKTETRREHDDALVGSHR